MTLGATTTGTVNGVVAAATAVTLSAGSDLIVIGQVVSGTGISGAVIVTAFRR